MPTLTPLPAQHLEVGATFAQGLHPDAMVFFLLNVGDADAQLILLPRERALDHRRAVIVDAGRSGKLPQLLEQLAQHDLLPTTPNGDLADGAIALVVATHPHHDHIAGIPELLRVHGHAIDEFWDPGYYHTTHSYSTMMQTLESQPHIVYTQPTSGMKRFIGNAAVTVLSPSTSLRNRFDTYGVEVNDSSISLRIETPASRVVERTEGRALSRIGQPATLVLGADAQTLSWSSVLMDFPNLPHSGTDVARHLRAATGKDLLASQVFKVSHHGSKNGVNLELVARISPRWTLVSCADDGEHHFPHAITQEVLREAREPIAGSGSPRAVGPDSRLGIFYTADVDDAGQACGSMAVVMRPASQELWRFDDDVADDLDLTAARRWKDV